MKRWKKPFGEALILDWPGLSRISAEVSRGGGVKRLLRDWWRGWSDLDLYCALLKVRKGNEKPGGLIPMSGREMRAYLSHYREKYR